MAHDFASRPRKKSPTETADARVRGATPRSPEAAQPESVGIWSRLPGWGWLAIGLIVGVLLGRTLDSSPEPQVAATTEEAVADPVAEEAASATRAENSASGEHQPRFDFYTLLPESEVIAPKVEAYESTPRDATDQPKFMLQVGSFSQPQDAIRQQQRITQLGFAQVRINTVETPSGDIWHRVQAGPFQDRRNLARAQDDLAAAGIDFMLLRLREEPEQAAPAPAETSQAPAAAATETTAEADPAAPAAVSPQQPENN
ncbi:SPOR domain-containing protein [Marinospirillum perlucidum]|uniref:SPOR domain-containing protein n=1 Tax=Marinospirillum perlucidum TaxID=1982602 RepID=UPI000DF39C15|nr:SPOR domain-containing protein [Marinospirillum perlucidum]